MPALSLVSEVRESLVSLKQIFLQPFKIVLFRNLSFLLLLFFVESVRGLQLGAVELLVLRGVLVIDDVLDHVLMIRISIWYESIDFLNSQIDAYHWRGIHGTRQVLAVLKLGKVVKLAFLIGHRKTVLSAASVVSYGLLLAIHHVGSISKFNDFN